MEKEFKNFQEQTALEKSKTNRIAQILKSCSEMLAILHHVLDIFSELRLKCLVEPHSDACDVIVVRATLKTWKYRIVDTLSEIRFHVDRFNSVLSGKVKHNRIEWTRGHDTQARALTPFWISFAMTLPPLAADDMVTLRRR